MYKSGKWIVLQKKIELLRYFSIGTSRHVIDVHVNKVTIFSNWFVATKWYTSWKIFDNIWFHAVFTMEIFLYHIW